MSDWKKGDLVQITEKRYDEAMYEFNTLGSDNVWTRRAIKWYGKRLTVRTIAGVGVCIDEISEYEGRGCWWSPSAFEKYVPPVTLPEELFTL